MILPCEKEDPVIEPVQGDGLGPAKSQAYYRLFFHLIFADMLTDW